MVQRWRMTSANYACISASTKPTCHWDLHGDNLMRRVKDGKIVIMDPFAPKMGDYMEE